MNCSRCRGTGQTPYTHIEGGRCFKCDGAGWIGPRPKKEEEWFPTAWDRQLERFAHIENPFAQLVAAAEDWDARKEERAAFKA